MTVSDKYGHENFTESELNLIKIKLKENVEAAMEKQREIGTKIHPKLNP